MRLGACPRTTEAVATARVAPRPDLAEHLEGCSTCREARQVGAALQALADGEPPRSLPPAATLWWRASVVRRLAADRPPPDGPPWLGALLAGAAAVGLAAALTAGTFVASPLPRSLVAALASGGGGTLVMLLAAAPLALLVALAWLAAE